MKRGIVGKKAGVAKSFEELGYYVIAGFIILISFFVFSVMMSSGGEVSQQEAINNAFALGRAIERMVESNATYETYEMYLSIPSNYIIVGFDKDWHGDMIDESWFGEDEGYVQEEKVESNWCSDGEGIQKPSMCEGVACICLYEDTWGDDFMEDNSISKEDTVMPCVQLLGDVSISGLGDSEAGYFARDNGLIDGGKKLPSPMPLVTNQGYEFLVMYGDCSPTWNPPRKILIEKYVSDGKTYITVAPITEETKPLLSQRNLTLSRT